MIEALILAGGGYLVLLAALFLLQRRLIYYPAGDLPTPRSLGLADFEAVRLATEDGLSLVAWYAPAGPEGRTIVLFHGNAGHIAWRAEKIRPYRAAGHGVLLVEYRGYGGNPGRPSERGLHRDARAALDFLDGRGVRREAIVLYGESLGAAVALALAEEAAVGGVVLEAAFTSLADVAAHHYWWAPVRCFLLDRFDNVARISRVEAPLLILHGEADDIVPARLARRLFEAAREPRSLRLIPGAGHNDLDRFGVERPVLEFLAGLPRGGTGAAEGSDT